MPGPATLTGSVASAGRDATPILALRVVWWTALTTAASAKRSSEDALIPTNKVSTDNVQTLSAMAKLTGEIDESASDVVVHGMVR